MVIIHRTFAKTIWYVYFFMQFWHIVTRNLVCSVYHLSLLKWIVKGKARRYVITELSAMQS